MGADYKPGPAMFQYQPIALLNRAGATVVQNTYYTVLETWNARIYGIGAAIATVAESLQLRVTVDGIVIDGAVVACAFGAAYFAYIFENAVAQNEYISLSNVDQYRGYRAFLLEGRHILIEIQKTTANGAGNLQAAVTYGILN